MVSVTYNIQLLQNLRVAHFFIFVFIFSLKLLQLSFLVQIFIFFIRLPNKLPFHFIILTVLFIQLFCILVIALLLVLVLLFSCPPTVGLKLVFIALFLDHKRRVGVFNSVQNILVFGVLKHLSSLLSFGLFWGSLPWSVW